MKWIVSLFNNLKDKLFKKKELTLIESLKKLKQMKLNFYLDEFNTDPHSFLEKDIIATIAKYKYINTFPIEYNSINVGSISPFSYKTMMFYNWFSSNGSMITNKDEVIQEWLDESIKLAKLYEFRITLQGIPNNSSYNNAKKIAPYYYDLDRLVKRIMMTI